ncbi:MAG: hypothetical protein WCA79_06555, partial [Anaerolineales bacterium]
MFLRRKSFLLSVGTILFAAGLACVLSGAPAQSAIPPASQTTQIAQINTQAVVAFTPTTEVLPMIATGQPTSEPTESPRPAIPESRRLTLEYPPSIRVGDSDVIRLTLELDTLGNVTPTAEVRG